MKRYIFTLLLVFLYSTLNSALVLSEKREKVEPLHAVIEIAKGTSVKYEEDKSTGKMVVNRFLYTAMNYPFNYGYIPNTLAEDGDPLDIAVISTSAVFSGCILPSRIIGMLEMEDEAGIDHKIIAVPTQKIDPSFAHVNDIDDLDANTKSCIKHFFENYKSTEPGKWVKVKNFLSKEVAFKVMQKSQQAYEQAFGGEVLCLKFRGGFGRPFQDARLRD